MDTLNAYFSMLNNADWAGLERLTWPDGRVSVPGVGSLPGGAAGLRMYLTLLAEAFEPLHFEVLARRGEFGWVRTHWRLRGIHTADFLDIPPTLRYVALEGTHHALLRGGRIAKQVFCFDQDALVARLRAEPPAECPGVPGRGR